MKLNFSLRTRNRLDHPGANDLRTNDPQSDAPRADASQAEAKFLAMTTRTLNPQWELYKALLSLSLSEPVYEKAAGRLSPIRELIRENDPEFVAKLAVWLGEQINFRKLAFILSVELIVLHGKEALHGKHGNKDWTSQLIGRVIQQPEDIPAWLGSWFDYSARVNGKGTRIALGRPDRQVRQVRKGLAVVLNRMNEYRFVRYDRDTQLKLKYALSLVRPKAKDKVQRVLFAKILADKFPVRSSWALELDALQHQYYDSAAVKQLALREKWKELISSFKMGYPALLANIQPVLTAGVSGKALKLVAEYLGNAAAIARSRQMPFSLLETYRELKAPHHCSHSGHYSHGGHDGQGSHGGSQMLMDALEQAVVHSAENLDGFEADTRVLVAMDVSHSMRHPLHGPGASQGPAISPGSPASQNPAGSHNPATSQGSTTPRLAIQRFDVGPLLAMLLQRRCRQVTTGILGNTWKTIDLRPGQVLAGVDQFHSREGEAGYATNGHLVIRDLLKRELIADKVIIFTDCQLWNSRPFNQTAGTDIRRLWRQYGQINPHSKLYLFDLAGNGPARLDIPEENVYLVSGWSDRIFEVLKAMENGDEVIGKIGNTACA
jgi:60 kDa SS-A/Ro ribonucleoprotein